MVLKLRNKWLTSAENISVYLIVFGQTMIVLSSTVLSSVGREQVRVDRVADIHLSTESGRNNDLVRFNNKAREYQRVPNEDLLLHLLSLPSRVTHRDQLLLLQQKVSQRGLQQRLPLPPPAPAKKGQSLAQTTYWLGMNYDETY